MEEDPKYITPFSAAVEDIAKRFDKATDEKNIPEIKKLLAEAKTIVKNEEPASQASLFYSMGTVYSDLGSLLGLTAMESTQQQLFFFRKSIKLIEAERFDDERYWPYLNGFKEVLFTNYGNALDVCGRKIAAIDQYKKALSIHKDFGMALGNLGRAYQHYANLDYDTAHRDILHHFAYYYLVKGRESKDPNTYENAKKGFQKCIERYDPEYIEHVLKPDLSFKEFRYDNQQESAYRHWCLQNGLFLNTLNDLTIIESSFSADVIQLPPMITGLGTKPIYHGMFNQLKQEYIYARYLYYSTLQEPATPHFADKETCITFSTDYARYSIRLEKIKTAFKTLYGLFDKTAFFLNSYFDLGIKEKDISFRSVWESSGGHGKNKYQYRNTLQPEDNIALSTLYWISKDFYCKDDGFSPNPELKRIRDIRNALEHKYVKITDRDSFGVTESGEDGLALYITETELYEITLGLLKILREAIISLSLCVNIAELPNREKAKDELVLSIHLFDYEDEWKT